MKNNLQKLLGQRIKQLRKSKGLNQEMLAEKLNIAINTLSNIERGNAFMTAKTMEKLAETFKISYNELFNFGTDIDDNLYENIMSKLNLLKENKEKLALIDTIMNQIITI